MDRFWDAWEKSTIVSGAVALGLTSAVIYLAVTGNPIPEALSFGFGAVIGFFFGSKGRDATTRAVAALQSQGEV